MVTDLPFIFIIFFYLISSKQKLQNKVMSHTMGKWVLRAKSIKLYTCTNRRVKNININFKNLTPVVQPPNLTLIAS